MPVLALLENSNDEDSVALKIDSCETTQELPKISESTVEAVATVDVRPHSRSRLGMVSAAAVACLLAVAAASYIWRPAQGSPNKSAAPAPIVKKPEVSAPVAAVPVKPAEAQSPAPAAAIRQVPVPASAVSASAPPTITTRALTGDRKSTRLNSSH